VEVAPGVDEALKNFVLPETLGFGAINAPVMFSAEWRDQQWSRGRLLPYRDTLLAIQERRAPDPFGWIRVLS
jgi:hypothetical protein